MSVKVCISAPSGEDNRIHMTMTDGNGKLHQNITLVNQGLCQANISQKIILLGFYIFVKLTQLLVHDVTILFN